MRVREGTVTITGSHPHSRWSLCAQGHSILSQYQASYPAILDIATSLSLTKLFGSSKKVGLYGEGGSYNACSASTTIPTLP